MELKEKIKAQALKNQKNNLMMEDIRTILEYLRPQTSSTDALSKLIELIAVKEIISMFKEDKQKKKDENDLFNRWMDWYMNMKMFKMFEKMFNLQDEEAEKLKALFEKRDREEQLIKVLEKMHEKDREFLSYLKEIQEKNIAQYEEYVQRLEQLIEQLQQKYTEDQLRLFQRFEQVVAELSRRGKFEELKRFVQEFTEFQKAVEEIDRLLDKLRVKKEPLVQEGGKINWDKLLDFLGNVLSKGISSPAPPKKTIETPQLPQHTQQLPQITEQLPKQEQQIKIEDFKAENIPKKQEIKVEEKPPSLEDIELPE